MGRFGSDDDPPGGPGTGGGWPGAGAAKARSPDRGAGANRSAREPEARDAAAPPSEQPSRRESPGIAEARRPAGQGPTPVEVPTPTLPRGGGAIRSIAEKFGVAAATGAGSMSIPIPLPPGRSGFGPSLSLRYGTGAGNGPFGIGFGIDVPAITRKTEKRLPRYRDDEDSDVFILGGFEDLVPLLEEKPKGTWVRRVDTPPGTNERRERYRPRVEGEFARIERVTDLLDGRVFWRVTTKENVTSTYGRRDDARLVDPADPSRVFSWLLEETRDDRGNVIRYEHKGEDLERVDSAPHEEHRRQGLAKVANRYLKRILYANRAGVAAPKLAKDFHFEVVLDYGEHPGVAPTPEEIEPWAARPDAFSSFRAGFEIRTYRLCRRVLVFHRFDELGPAPLLVRSTELEYEPGPAITYLKRITQRGHPGKDTIGPSATLPPVELEFQRATFSSRVDGLDAESLRGLPAGVDGRAYQWVDLDGEGVPGVLTQQGTALHYKRNLGEGRLAAPRTLRSQPSMARLGAEARGGQMLLDVTGDGLPDLVELGGPVRGFHAREGDDRWGPFRAFAELPNVDWSDPSLRFIDLDGDGFADVMMSEDRVYTWWPSSRERGFGEPRSSARFSDERRGPSVVFAEREQTVFLADMTGDGLADLVRVRNGSVCYWPNLGYGRFGPMVTMSGAPRLAPEGLYDPARIRLADIDGTGTADLLYIGDDGVLVSFNEAGNSFSEPVRLAVFPDASALSTVDVVDVLGSGTACLVWSTPLPGKEPQLRYVDLLGSKKPHLLVGVKNNLGLETRLAYTTSARLYLEDAARGERWATRIPFPVHVVERVEHYDRISRHRFVTTYRYRHGHYDTEEREFRGFAYVETRDAENVGEHLGDGLFPGYPVENGEMPLPPVVTKTRYHTGSTRDAGVTSALEHEWFQGGAGAPAEPAAIPPGLSRLERHQACRALAGRMLRQEVYAEDGSADEKKPYAVTQATWSVRRVQPTGGAPYASFLVSPRETVVRAHDRAKEGIPPRVTRDLVLEVDALGYATKTASVAHGHPSASAPPEQRRTWITVSEQKLFHHAEDPSWYRHGVPLASASWELDPSVVTGAGTLDAGKIAAATEVPFDVPASPGKKRLLSASRSRYWNEELTAPLPLGQVAHHALGYESYAKALTPSMMAKALEGKIDATVATKDGGYKQVGADGSYWAASGVTHHHPKAKFHLVRRVDDAFGTPTTIDHDPGLLFVVKVTDARGKTTEATIDRRVLAPRKVVDSNKNSVEAAFDALGRVRAVAVRGKKGEGDTLAAPTTRFTYEIDRFQASGKPARVKTERRETHADPATRWLVSFAYSNGSGAAVLSKTQAEPGRAVVLDAGGHLVKDNQGKAVFAKAATRWVGSGRVVVDNKGNPIKRYEPYFSPTEEYEDDADLARFGVTPVLRYDPLGRLVRTDFPDGTHALVAFDPWQQTASDANDTADDGQLWYDERKGLPAGDPERKAADKAHAHAGTPARTLFDALGRAVVAIEHERAGNPPVDSFPTTRTQLDVQGNVLAVIDAAGRPCMVYERSMLAQVLRQTSIDAGTRRSFASATGEPLLRWGERGFTERFAYDELRRPTHVWVDDGAGEKLVERLVYRDDEAADAENRRGRLVAHYDQAGVVLADRYDFKGNLAAQSRRLAKDAKSVADWSALEKLEADAALAAAAPQLEAQTYAQAFAFDALDRPTTVTTPDLTKIAAGYNAAGLLETVKANLRGAADGQGPKWTAFVENIDYDEKGRRTTIAFSNGTDTTYSYDPRTFRLTYFRTKRKSDGKLLQSVAYTYDAAGNIVATHDKAAQDVIFGAPPAASPDGDYTYSALYRLVRAEGREHLAGAEVQRDEQDLPLNPIPHANDPTGLRRYVERYAYDAVGNFVAFAHKVMNGPPGADWTRKYAYAPGSNRLAATTRGQEVRPYSHDAHGNMTKMPHLPSIDWDFADRMRHAETSVGGDQHVWFVYDAAGERVRKLYEHDGVVEERIYLGGFELYRRHAAGKLDTERETLHIADDARRICMVETLTVKDGAAVKTPKPRSRFQLDNHLGTVALEVDEAGGVISYEEYHPYGTSAYRAAKGGVEVSAKRYRYTGKERDEETGLYYHGARYYAPWLARWTAADPIGVADGTNLYAYARARPVDSADPSGTQTETLVRRPETFVRQEIDTSKVIGDFHGNVRYALKPTGRRPTDPPPPPEPTPEPADASPPPLASVEHPEPWLPRAFVKEAHERNLALAANTSLPWHVRASFRLNAVLDLPAVGGEWLVHGAIAAPQLAVTETIAAGEHIARAYLLHERGSDEAVTDELLAAAGSASTGASSAASTVLMLSTTSSVGAAFPNAATEPLATQAAAAARPAPSAATAASSLPKVTGSPSASIAQASQAAARRVAASGRKGKLWERLLRDRLANDPRLELLGEQVRVPTPFGVRIIDFVVGNKSTGQVFPLEAKTATAAYKELQQLKDWWIHMVSGAKTILVRPP